MAPATPSSEALPTNLVALGARRERAIALIGDRYAEGLLDDDEVDRRLELAERATDLAQLDALTVDLEAPAEAPGGPAHSVALAKPDTALAVPGTIPAARSITNVLSSSEYTGAWTPARHTKVLTVLGNTTLDLREANLGAGEIEIRVKVVLGDAVIILPPTIRVTLECTPILGDIKRDEGPTSLGPESPHLRISGFVVLGDVKIRYQAPGESWRETKKRRKRLAKERRKALKAGRG